MKKFTASRLLLIAASCWILLGIITLSSYQNTYIPAIRYAGIVLLLDGLLLTGVSYRCNTSLTEKKWIRAEAIPDLLFSIFLLLDPVFSLLAFPFIVGPWIVMKGLITMIASLSLAKNIHGWSGDLTGGFLLICCGLLIGHDPLENPFGVNVLTGVIGWTIGLLYLYDAFRFRKMTDTLHAMS